MNIKNIIRDTAFLFFISYWSGFLFGLAGWSEYRHVFLIVNYLCVFAGFCFLAYWDDTKKLKHFIWVAGFLWITALPEHILINAYFKWFLSGIGLLIMAVSSFWLLSFLSKRKG